jgi:hypothetical protein
MGLPLVSVTRPETASGIPLPSRHIIQTYIVAEGALGRRGHIEWAEHGRLSRPRGLSVVNGVNQHGYPQDVG